jgi:hypothetical protein
MALSAIGILTGSKELSMAGMIISTAAAILQVAATILIAAAMWDAIPIVGHTGLELPRFHSGSDEIPAILQRGEWVINRTAVSALSNAYGAGAFKMFNSGQVPAIPVSGRTQEYNGAAAGGGGGVSVVYSPTYHINAIDARGVDKILEKHGRIMTKTLQREVGRRGRSL